MIIYGTRGITSTLEPLQFFCPQCRRQTQGDLRHVRRYFTLYFIPIIPMDVIQRFVECRQCRGAFSEDIKDFDPEVARREMATHLMRVTVMAALADGRVDEAERAVIQDEYRDFAGLPLPEETLDQEIGLAAQSGAHLNSFVAGVADDLSPHARARFVEATYRVMAAGGMTPSHQQQLAQLATTLSIPEDQFRELIAGANDR